MQRRSITAPVILIFVLAALLIASAWFTDHYILMSFAVLAAGLLFMLVRFESRKMEVGELVIIAVIAAIASVGRIPFAGIPGAQPTTFVIIVSGVVFGAETGFMVGGVAALASNMVLGQGPWTPWQMAVWGLIGIISGLLRNRRFMQNKWGRILFGAVCGYFFGAIMNIWGLYAAGGPAGTLSTKMVLSYFGASLLFDSFHAISNALFLLVFGDIFIKILTRFKGKYGLLQ
ncbi:ECF transporter S component [Bacillus massilinigeriensis]|uniref:ECF transporter S component n=1 Tax=Bacillus mediterraneensis TaxID=1805474 RepID=UPI0008F8861F|nr:ECF transporter S component [Bacillus mediterraneensis]